MLTMSEIQAMITDAIDNLENAYSLTEKAKAKLRSAIALYEDCKTQDSTILKGLEEKVDWDEVDPQMTQCAVCGEELVEGRDTIHGEVEDGVLVNLAHIACARKVS